MKVMQKSLFGLLSGLIFVSGYVYADCNFEFVNNSAHPVTLQGFYLDSGDELNNQSWITIPAGKSITQTRAGNAGCNGSYRHSGQLITKVELKNSSGFWVGDKGFLFASDRSYANIGTDKAMSDDESDITLSNGIPITEQKFKVMICDDSVDSDDCQ